MEMSFIADANVGKLARWLRTMGYDALFFKNIDDNRLIDIALKEKRIILTKDTQLMKRRIITEGKLKAILIQADNPEEQLRQVVKELGLNQIEEFSRCLECNQSLEPKTKEEVRNLVPPYVLRTQSQYMQCPSCRRIYWRGTHWQRMKKELAKLTDEK
jgi:uncharacterized protein with PIN domain